MPHNKLLEALFPSLLPWWRYRQDLQQSFSIKSILSVLSHELRCTNQYACFRNQFSPEFVVLFNLSQRQAAAFTSADHVVEAVSPYFTQHRISCLAFDSTGLLLFGASVTGTLHILPVCSLLFPAKTPFDPEIWSKAVLSPSGFSRWKCAAYVCEYFAHFPQNCSELGIFAHIVHFPHPKK